MPLMIDKHDANEQKKSLHFVKQIYLETKLDGNFQRYGGFNTGSGWNLKNGLSFLENLVMGATYNCIIIIDVREALRYAQEKDCENSIEYYQNVLDEGYKYVSVDGNNTASFVTAFLDSRDGVGIKINGAKKRKLFNKLSEEDQVNIQYTEKINVVTLRKILIGEACDLFRNVNQQTKLNHQEHRQARWSELSKFVRDIANGDNRKIFLNFVYNKETDLDTRSHEEMVAMFALKIHKNYATRLQCADLNSFYEDNDSLKLATETNISNTLQEVRKMAEQTNEGAPIQRKLTKGTLHNLFDFVLMVTEEKGFSIKKSADLFSWFLEADAMFRAEAGKITEDNQKDESYSYWTKFCSKNYHFYQRNLAMFEAMFLRDIESLVSKGIVKPKRSAGDTFTWEQKLELFVKQEAMLRTGDKMNILDLYLGKYEADHMVSINDGGETTIENGELMTMIENRQKGANSNEPHFEHQL
jgi:hypothetical protein